MFSTMVHHVRVAADSRGSAQRSLLGLHCHHHHYGRSGGCGGACGDACSGEGLGAGHCARRLPCWTLFARLTMQLLSRTNAMLRRIDLTCSVLGPLVCPNLWVLLIEGGRSTHDFCEHLRWRHRHCLVESPLGPPRVLASYSSLQVISLSLSLLTTATSQSCSRPRRA